MSVEESIVPIKTFKTGPTNLCIVTNTFNYVYTQNPNFEMEEQVPDFLASFDELSTFDILLKLRADDDSKFKVDFHVNFTQIELIARDMQQIKEYDFELLVFNFGANYFFTTKSLYHKLQETVMS